MLNIKISIIGKDEKPLEIPYSESEMVQINIDGKEVYTTAADFIRGLRKDMSRFIDPKTKERLIQS